MHTIGSLGYGNELLEYLEKSSLQKAAKVIQDSANWNGNGQLFKNGAIKPIIFDSEVFDAQGFHDNSVHDSGTATGTHSATTLQDTGKSWTVNEWAGYVVQITGGTDVDDVGLIISNTADTLTIDAAGWITTVDNTSTYEISLKHRLTIPTDADGLFLLVTR